MSKTYKGKYGHTAEEYPHSVGITLPGIGDDDAETYAEEQGEERIELAVDKCKHQLADDFVYVRLWHGCMLLSRQKGV